MIAAAAPSPASFSRGGALALVGGGLALFVAMLWLIGAGSDFGGGGGGRGQAHAAANGLNGYAGLVQLVEAQGYEVQRSRSSAGLESDGLLVIAPAAYADADDIAGILTARSAIGPTLVILPKWLAMPPTERLPEEVRRKFKRGWVMLGDPIASGWPENLPRPYRFDHKLTGGEDGSPPVRWQGLGQAGTLPTRATMHAEPAGSHDVLIADAGGRALAFKVAPRSGDQGGQPVIFLAEPDLANNYGLADPARAAAAIALVDAVAGDGATDIVTFDMTLNGFGASENLLTLAFRPPFLAATLSLITALLIVGWRAFQRFGPPAAPAGPDIAFGKRQLIANGAGLIVRARRFGLLGAPYAALSARRIGEQLGLAASDGAAIDAALARRLPAEEPFTRRAARLEAARKPADILAAAQSLDDLSRLLSEPASTGTFTR